MNKYRNDAIIIERTNTLASLSLLKSKNCHWINKCENSVNIQNITQDNINLQTLNLVWGDTWNSKKWNTHPVTAHATKIFDFIYIIASVSHIFINYILDLKFTQWAELAHGKLLLCPFFNFQSW